MVPLTTDSVLDCFMAPEVNIQLSFALEGLGGPSEREEKFRSSSPQPIQRFQYLTLGIESSPINGKVSPYHKP